MIHEERVKRLNDKGVKDGDYLLYWMQSSVRTEYNHALEYSILEANRLNQPLIVFFGLTENYPEANLRHYYFLLEGLKQARSSLEEKGIGMVIWRGSPDQGAVELGREASMVVVDEGYTRLLRSWRGYVAERLDCPLIQVETDVIVPVETASFKEEYSAATFRRRIKGKLSGYLIPLKGNDPKHPSLHLVGESFDVADVDNAISRLHIDKTVRDAGNFKGGTSQAKRHLEFFIENRLDKYSDFRNDPTADYLSNMSPYLHFGQISPLYIALKINATDSPGRESYLEELIIRRELGVNFVHYNPNYDTFEGLPEWCRRTLAEHHEDQREYTYTLEEFERAETHDPYWNSAQREMVLKGKMHGYMRMYWGKKILEWSQTPEEAYQTALYLNNKYELDGRDPNGYAGVAWCFGKHDRPWKERPIFGKVRYMSAEGLKRKFDADLYVEKMKELEDRYISFQ